MSNSHTQFCCELNELTEIEATWLDGQVKIAEEWLQGDERYEASQTMVPPNALARSAAIDCDIYTVGFLVDREWSATHGSRRLFYDDGGEGQLEPLAELISEFLRIFRPNTTWGFTWAATCSRQLPDEFGGGAVLVKANEIEYMNTWSWLEERGYGTTD